MSMCSQNGSYAAIEIPAHCDLLRSRFGVQVHDNDLRLRLLDQAVGHAERVVVVDHKDTALQIDDSVWNSAASCPLIVPASGNCGGIVRRTQHSARRAAILHSR